MLCRAYIISYDRSTILSSYQFGKPWAQKWLLRHNYSLRTSTTSKAKKNEDQDIKNTFIKRVSLLVAEFKIPPNLLINMDESGLNFLPVHKRTYDKKGSTSVLLKFCDDKRQVTIGVSGTSNGIVLPPQIIFKGKTRRVIPKDPIVPENWLLSFTYNHWSTEESMIEWMEKILLPYKRTVIQENNLKEDHKCLLLLDVYWSHREISFRKYADENNVIICYIPANYTWWLQPMDQQPNRFIKKTIKEEFEKWHIGILVDQLQSGKDIEINFSLLELKKNLLSWLKISYDKLEKSDSVLTAFHSCGINKAWDPVIQVEALLNKKDLSYDVGITKSTKTKKKIPVKVKRFDTPRKRKLNDLEDELYLNPKKKRKILNSQNSSNSDTESCNSDSEISLLNETIIAQRGKSERVKNTPLKKGKSMCSIFSEIGLNHSKI